MRITLNCEALINLAHKRLCRQATKEMQTLVGLMCAYAESACPWLKGLLVPMCEYRGGVCHEFYCCGKRPWVYDEQNREKADAITDELVKRGLLRGYD